MRDILSKGPKYREPTTFSWKYNFKLVLDSVEDYARRWAKEEEVELDSLSEWIKSIRHLLKRRMYMAGRSVNNKPKSVFSDTDVTEHLADLHNRYVIVPTDKASNNVVFVCKIYYFECLQIYTSTIKSPSAVQISKSIKQTQSVDKVYYNTRA